MLTLRAVVEIYKMQLYNGFKTTKTAKLWYMTKMKGGAAFGLVSFFFFLFPSIFEPDQVPHSNIETIQYKGLPDTSGTFSKVLWDPFKVWH